MSVCFSATRTALAQTNGTSGIIISEFRLDGPNGSGDEFVEIVNNTSSPKTIVSSDAPLFTGFSVWGVVAGQPAKVCTIPNGTLLNPGQHYLCARTTGPGAFELGDGTWRNETTGASGAVAKLPDMMLDIIATGGVMQHLVVQGYLPAD